MHQDAEKLCVQLGQHRVKTTAVNGASVIHQTTKVNLCLWTRSKGCLLALQWKITMELLWVSVFWITKTGTQWLAGCGPLVQILPLNLTETRGYRVCTSCSPCTPDTKTTKVQQCLTPAAAQNGSNSGVAADLEKRHSISRTHSTIHPLGQSEKWVGGSM